MAEAAEIRGVFTGEWHDVLHQVVYTHICNKLQGGVVDSIEPYSYLPPALALRAAQVHDVQRLWRQQASRVGSILGSTRSVKTLVCMTHCHPAGVSYTPHRYIACRQYLCCPFCFYRKLTMLVERLALGLRPGLKLAVSVTGFHPKGNGFVGLAVIREAAASLRRLGRCESFRGGVALRYLATDANGHWGVVLVVLGLLDECQAIQNEAQVSWWTYPATDLGIKQAVLRHIRYPTAVLSQAPTLEVWRGLTTYLRYMRSGNLTTTRRMDQHVCDLQRPTHPAKDMGVPAGPTFGQLLQLCPSDELLFELEDTAGSWR